MIMAKAFILILILLIFGSLLRIKLNNGVRIVEKITFIILFCLGSLLILKPVILQLFSNFLSINRSIDLLFYSYILVSMWVILRTHIRINRLENTISSLVCKLSLKYHED